MKGSQALLALLCFSSCATLTTTERWTPAELIQPEGLELVVSDHIGPTAGMIMNLSGGGRVATVPLSPQGLHLSIRDRSTSLWALGLLLPILPTFGIGPDEEDERVQLGLRMAFEGDSRLGVPVEGLPQEIFSIDPRSVRILPATSDRRLQPVAWSVYGHHGDPGDPLPEPGDSLTLGARQPLVLYFDATHAELESAGGFVLELEVATSNGKSEEVRLRFRPGGAWHFTLAG